MVKTRIPPESGETVCPACGAGIKAGPSARRRRIQCPKCREVVVLENFHPEKPKAASQVLVAPAASPASPAPDTAAETRGRMEALEARVATLEAALKESLAAALAAAANPAPRKLFWVTGTLDQSPDFAVEQGQALFHNLAGVRSQTITIRTPAGHPTARNRAEWFKSIFERAGWTVQGPEEIAPETAVPGLSMAVPELPVPKEAAATYLALKAAGFEPTPILDPTSAGDSGQGAALSLTLPPEKAA